MIAIEIILHIMYSKNTGIYSGFCMCHILKDEDEDIYVIHPLLQVGPGRGGDHIYIYIYYHRSPITASSTVPDSRNHLIPIKLINQFSQDVFAAVSP